MSGWVLVLLSQGAIAAGSWLLSRHFGWEVAVAVALIVEGAIGAVYGMINVGSEAEPWHGGALHHAEEGR